MIHSHNFPRITKHHDLILRVPDPLLFPLVYRYARRCTRVFPGDMEYPTPRLEQLIALSLLRQRPVHARVVGVGGDGAGVEPGGASAGAASEGVEHVGIVVMCKGKDYIVQGG